MLFIAILLLILSIVFIYYGFRTSRSDLRTLGFVFLIATIGTSFITYLALSAL